MHEIWFNNQSVVITTNVLPIRRIFDVSHVSFRDASFNFIDNVFPPPCVFNVQLSEVLLVKIKATTGEISLP